MYSAYANITHTKQLLSTRYLPFWFGVAYELQLASYGLPTVSKDASRARSQLLELLLKYFWCGV